MFESAAKGQPDRRRDILDAATRLFGAQGYRNTTTDEIAEAAHVTKRTMYRYARSKEQILLLIHERFLDAVDALSGDWATGSAEKRLQRFVEAYVTVVVDNQDEVRVFFEENKNLSIQNRATVIERRDSFERSLRELISTGVEEQEFRPTDVAVTSAGILGGLADCYRWYSPDGAASPKEIAATASDLFLHGLADAGQMEQADTGPSPAAGIKQAIEALSEGAADARRIPTAVVEAARALFVKHGYLATSTREIAARAGITKSALFYHIGSKEELLYALQDDFGRRSLAIAADHLGTVTAPAQVVEALRQFVVAHCRIIDAEPEAVELFTDQFRYLEGGYRDQIVEMRDLYTSALRRVIEYGVGAKALRAVDVKVTTLVIIGMLNSLYRWYRKGGRLSAEEVGDSFANLILLGLRHRR